jgi:hypothetical protein
MAASKAEAPFVFEGSVKSLTASNVAAVPADARTVVVQVNHVRHAPRAMAGFAGQDVTVRLAPGESLRAGERAVFFADGLVFGDHLAVQSLGHGPLIAHEARAALAGASPVVHKLRNRIDAAQSVVSGQVSAVRPHQLPAVAAKGKRSGAVPEGRISEHAPFWQDAVITVSQVHKGPAKKQVVVRFPSSTDVRWRSAPKFKKGQQGTWLLHAGAGVGAGGALRAVGAKDPVAAPSVYTALDPNDFQPSSESTVVRAMFPAAAAAKAAKGSPVAAGTRRKKSAARKRGSPPRAKSRAKGRA